MLEIIAASARWVQLAANLVLLGSCIFVTIANTKPRTYSEKWTQKLERYFPWLALSIPICLIVTLMTMIAQITGTTDMWRQDVWLGIIQETRAGQIWVWRIASALLLVFSVLYLINASSKARWQYLFCASIATLPLIAGSFASHIAAEELSLIAIAPYVLHLILAGIWFGALPAFLLLIHDHNKNGKTTKSKPSEIEILQRFSSIALPVMLVIILTGVLIADRLLDGHYAALVATPYGWLLSVKILLLCVILLIAVSVRAHWLPLLTDGKDPIQMRDARMGMKKWVRIEFLLALILILIATLIANTTPVKHATIEEWIFPFRFSVEATWNKPNVALQVWSGVAILLLAVLAIQFGRLRRWTLKRLIAIPSLMFVSGVAIVLPPLTIEAYPETYRKPPAPFDAISISNGAALYMQHCVECHGPQGMGNGIKSRTLSTKLPDLLIEPHIVEHTPGDFYNWITYGMKNTDMPGYADKMSEDDRWDLVNYIHALSRGYQARILSPEIIFEKVFAKPPLFSFNKHDGSQGALQEFRERKTVLLILFSWPQSQERLAQLRQTYDRLQQQNIEILAVPTQELGIDELEQASAALPFSVVTQGAPEIVNSYMLWRRTLNHPDIIGRGKNPEHIEFLFDKKGYLRARWIPSRDQSGWSDADVLIRQVSQLNREQTQFPFPEDYIR